MVAALVVIREGKALTFVVVQSQRSNLNLQPHCCRKKVLQCQNIKVNHAFISPLPPCGKVFWKIVLLFFVLDFIFNCHRKYENQNRKNNKLCVENTLPCWLNTSCQYLCSEIGIYEIVTQERCELSFICLHLKVFTAELTSQIISKPCAHRIFTHGGSTWFLYYSAPLQLV